MLKHHSRQTPISDGLRKELASDISSALGARQTAVDWGVAEAAEDTNLFEHTVYKLASRLLRVDRRLIESHARKLTRRGTNEGDALRKWSGDNASPLDFDESENTQRTENNIGRSRALSRQLEQSASSERSQHGGAIGPSIAYRKF